MVRPAISYNRPPRGSVGLVVKMAVLGVFLINFRKLATCGAVGRFPAAKTAFIILGFYLKSPWTRFSCRGGR